jgi:3-isopropylmalate/(R)-2-methylmalate dehydratase small subunit
MSADFKRRQVSGRGIPLPGNDIDTDRIIPARFLKAVTFEGMGEHAFEDARKQSPEHPFNQTVYQGASVLVVGQNFGCGSSREHAPQALMRWGIRAIVGGSFGEIFFGNCVMLGIPCLVASQADIEWLQKAIARAPQQPVTASSRRPCPTDPATSSWVGRGIRRRCCSRPARRSRRRRGGCRTSQGTDLASGPVKRRYDF